MLYFIMFVLGYVLACIMIYILSRQKQIHEVEKRQREIIKFQIQSLDLQEKMNDILSSIDRSLYKGKDE